jgi:hypothetical protein
MEVLAHQVDEARALLGVERFKQSADVGFVQIAGERANLGGVSRVNGGGNAFDEVMAQAPVFVAHGILSSLFRDGMFREVRHVPVHVSFAGFLSGPGSEGKHVIFPGRNGAGA